jgi:alkyldihydroxyacetonephosphate synthase
MRRWNGWGKEETSYHLPELASEYLQNVVGAGDTSPDASLEQVLKSIPSPTLPPHSLITFDALTRLMHARGQSLPDWVALHSGQIGAFPDGIAYPVNSQEVQALLTFAYQAGVRLIPYGGGTSVVGHINPPDDGAPTLTVDLSRLNQLLDLDEISRLATFGAGICGPDLETQLNQRGYTLGHFPQSFELSTLGGWIASRSCGQQSYYYGRIEDLFAGGQLETPLGRLDFPVLPASAAGPDLRQLILGSEGRMGILTQATVRVRRLPETEAFYGVFFRTWHEGVEAVRQIAQQRIPISMARLSDAQETITTLKLSGKDRLVGFAESGLNWIGYQAERCLFIFGITGNARQSKLALRQVLQICRSQGGLFTGQTIGKIWRKSRFLTPYLRNTLWERGYALDTLETALPWRSIEIASPAIKAAIENTLSQQNERGLVFAHLSHVYRDGASIYTTFLFRRALHQTRLSSIGKPSKAQPARQS